MKSENGCFAVPCRAAYLGPMCICRLRCVLFMFARRKTVDEVVGDKQAPNLLVLHSFSLPFEFIWLLKLLRTIQLCLCVGGCANRFMCA